MSKSRRSFDTSVPCRLEWRPSRQVGALLFGLVLLAPFCLIQSDLPRAWAWPLAGVAAWIGMRDARRYLRLPPRTLLVPAGRGMASCDGQRIQSLRLRWRGPLAFLDWWDAAGRRHRVALWPDTLDRASRRELELAMQRREAAAGGASVAP